MRTFIIAEAGVNHNGSVDQARRLVDAAAAAGADAVKFQSFRADELATAAAPKAAYQQKTTGPSAGQRAMLRALELSPSAHEAVLAHARDRSIEWLSTPFDHDSLELLTGRLGLATIKISSGDLTNAPLLLATARAARTVLLSTGMATLAEVEDALGVLAFGFSRPGSEQPGVEAFRLAYSSPEGRAALVGRVTLLHCTSEYPAPVDDVNLRAMDTLATAFGLPVGYSDHTMGTHVPVAAVARGATVIEKHLTLDRRQAGVDHHVSAEPGEFARMVAEIREVERALGDGIKRPAPSERQNRIIVRRSLVAARALKAGEPFDVACKRPAVGLSPFEYWRVLKRVAERDYEADELIDA